MNSGEKFDCDAIVNELIQNQNNLDSHIEALAEHCKIELKSWHSNASRTIGKRLCTKKLICCLALLYSKIDKGDVNEKFMPLNIIKINIFKNIYTYDHDTLNKLKKEMDDKYFHKDSELNRKLIDVIKDYHQNLPANDQYHAVILSIYAYYHAPGWWSLFGDTHFKL